MRKHFATSDVESAGGRRCIQTVDPAAALQFLGGRDGDGVCGALRSSHPSLAVAPQVTATIYYWLPWAAERLLGFSEAGVSHPFDFADGPVSVSASAPGDAPDSPGCRMVRGVRGLDADAASTMRRPMRGRTRWRPAWRRARVVSGALAGDGALAGRALVHRLRGALLWRVHLIEWPFTRYWRYIQRARAARRNKPVSWWRIVVVYAGWGRR